ncbi:4Fe-4S binding protein [Youngiibacter fragilis]|uniref:4Fe-4S ferredoxin n=1 Tax=Youngiibacter fragilis 232.1 TaxID=994573 RepID=V7HZQ8_9CLOT|nr:4Fe-4S binding protein [Youngiibacter fragilis]ETA79088.1 4Fe-4S ferredoxin [Youngiibacter fragilis 232.1]
MKRVELIQTVSGIVEGSSANRVAEDCVIRPELSGMRIFESPLFAFGDPMDPTFDKLKEKTVIGPHFMSPQEWMPGVKTVISIFLPFTEEVRRGKDSSPQWPSSAWLHGRIEGQAFINMMLAMSVAEIESYGYKAMAPSLDGRYWSLIHDGNTDTEKAGFSSNWSERHVAYISGHGTFGLSKGLITKHGIAGRFASILTDMDIEKDERYYTELYENCSMCGACAKRCPAGAISVLKGKDHKKCSDYLDTTAARFEPRYGCDKCQTKVPCETCIPEK